MSGTGDAGARTDATVGAGSADSGSRSGDTTAAGATYGSPTTSTAADSYPTCSASVTDKCVQRGKRRSARSR